MLKTLILLLPCSVCTIFSLVLLVRKGKSQSENILNLLAIFTAIYFFSDANFLFPSSTYHSLVYTDLMTQFICPSIPVIVYAYYRSLLGKNPYSHLAGVMTIPPMALFTVAFSLYYVVGLDTSADFIRAYDNPPIPEIYKTKLFRILAFSTKYACNFTAFAGIVYTIIYMFRQENHRRSRKVFATVKGFIFDKENTNLTSVQFIYISLILIIWAAKLFITRNYALSHQIIMDLLSITSSVILILIFLTGLLPKGSQLQFANMASPLSNIPDIDMTPQQEKEPEEKPLYNINFEDGERFFNYMEKEEAFRKHGQTIGDVAMELNTNRTYLSLYLNKTLKISFPEYLGNLRIEYAKTLLNQNPNESQAAIADACGFDSVATFSSKFKKTTGMTPGQYAAGVKIKG